MLACARHTYGYRCDTAGSVCMTFIPATVWNFRGVRFQRHMDSDFGISTLLSCHCPNYIRHTEKKGGKRFTDRKQYTLRIARVSHSLATGECASERNSYLILIKSFFNAQFASRINWILIAICPSFVCHSRAFLFSLAIFSTLCVRSRRRHRRNSLIYL